MSTVISRYFKTSAGNAFSSDSSMVSLEVNKIIVNVNTCERFKKISSNVFDKEGEEISDATTTSKGIMQVGTDLTVTDGVVSVADNFLRTNTTQNLTNTQANRILKNIGIEHVTSNSNAQRYCSRLAIGNTQILYGRTTQSWYHEGTGRYCTAMFAYPFISAPLVLGTPFITVGDDNATCGVITSSPRTALFGIGSPDHTPRVFYGAIGQTFPLDENASVSSSTLSTGTTSVSLDIYKNQIKLTDTNSYFLVDMFMSANSDNSDYIEFEGMSGVTAQSDAKVNIGTPRLSRYLAYDDPHLNIGYDLFLSTNPDSIYDDVYFSGYSDKSHGKIFVDPELNTYMMRSFIVSIPSTNISNDNTQYLRLSFNKSLSSGVSGFIRVFYIHS